MRHGLMVWREDELSQADILGRQRRLQSAMAAGGIAALLVYTNHVRSAGVTYLTGFTPYWSDGLLLLPREGQAIFATALSKRVGNWIRSTNPTAEITHSPQPGRIVGARLEAMGARTVGVVELDRMPAGLVEEISSNCDAQLTDATALFAAKRAEADAAELALAARADKMAAEALAAITDTPALVGDVTELLELKVRQAGAEECYVAAAPNLAADQRLARVKGPTPLGDQYAVRLSLAYNGVWIRRTESFARGTGDTAARAAEAAERVAAALDLSAPSTPQIEGHTMPEGLKLLDWTIEAPVATRPLETVASYNRPGMPKIPYGILTLRIAAGFTPFVFARPVGLSSVTPRERNAI